MSAPDATAEPKPPPILAFLREDREAIFREVASRGAANVRVFGSVAHRDATSMADIDLLADFVPDCGAFDEAGLARELEELLRYPVDDRLYLSHIAEAIARIRQSIDWDKARLFNGTNIQDTTLRGPHTLGECSQCRSQEVKGRHPEIHWADIVAFRNIVVHGYLCVDLSSVRAVIERDLGPLGTAVEAELPRTGDRASEISRDHDLAKDLVLGGPWR